MIAEAVGGRVGWMVAMILVGVALGAWARRAARRARQARQAARVSATTLPASLLPALLTALLPQSASEDAPDEVPEGASAGQGQGQDQRHGDGPAAPDAPQADLTRAASMSASKLARSTTLDASALGLPIPLQLVDPQGALVMAQVRDSTLLQRAGQVERYEGAALLRVHRPGQELHALDLTLRLVDDQGLTLHEERLMPGIAPLAAARHDELLAQRFRVWPDAQDASALGRLERVARALVVVNQVQIAPAPAYEPARGVPLRVDASAQADEDVLALIEVRERAASWRRYAHGAAPRAYVWLELEVEHFGLRPIEHMRLELRFVDGQGQPLTAASLWPVAPMDVALEAERVHVFRGTYEAPIEASGYELTLLQLKLVS